MEHWVKGGMSDSQILKRNFSLLTPGMAASGKRERSLYKVFLPHFCLYGPPAPMLATGSNEKDISYILITHSIHLKFLISFLPPLLQFSVSPFLDNLTWPVTHLQSPRCS